MNRDEALAFVCGPPCLELHAIDPAVLLPPTLTHAPRLDREEDAVVTWLAQGARFLTVIQTHAGTRIYDADEGLLYHAAPHAQLGPHCPVGHAFLCQTVQDTDPDDGTCTPRLLVTDLVSPRIDCPLLRGQALRSMACLLPPVCHLQWAGDPAVCEAFVASGAVPHPVAGLIALRRPLQLVCSPVTA